jgi:Holliday junction resolvasome RuvABC endonuclease subunit
MTVKKIMGFDISSSTVGICVLTQNDDHIELTHIEYFKPPKKSHIFEKLSKLKSHIKLVMEKWQPDEIAIEDFLLGMSGGRTNINTLSLLAIFNRTVGLTIYECSNKVPYMYSPIEIRKAIAINDVVPSKEQVPEFLEQHMNLLFPWIKKNNKRTKLAKIIVENYDMSDAMACAYCHILIGAGRGHFVLKKKKHKKVKFTSVEKPSSPAKLVSRKRKK